MFEKLDNSEKIKKLNRAGKPASQVCLISFMLRRFSYRTRKKGKEVGTNESPGFAFPTQITQYV